MPHFVPYHDQLSVVPLARGRLGQGVRMDDTDRSTTHNGQAAVCERWDQAGSVCIRLDRRAHDDWR